MRLTVLQKMNNFGVALKSKQIDPYWLTTKNITNAPLIQLKCNMRKIHRWHTNQQKKLPWKKSLNFFFTYF